MKYKLLKPLPGIEVGTIYDSTTEDPVTKEEADIELFVRYFGSDNDFFEPIKESKWWEPKEGEIYYVTNGDDYQYDDDKYDYFWISSGLAFKTKEEAEKQLKLMQAITRCRKYLVEHDMLLSDDEVMDISVAKNSVYYLVHNQSFHSSSWKVCQDYSPYGYINSEENAEKFMKDCEEDLKLIHLPS